MKRLCGHTRNGVFCYTTARGRTRWGIDYRDPETGRRRRKCVDSQELAERLSEAIRARKAINDVLGQGMLFSDAADAYLKHVEESGRGRRSYRYIQKEWPLALRYQRLVDIKTETIRRVLDNWKAKRRWAPSTRNQALSQLSGLFTYAIRQGWIDRHPIVGRIPRVRQSNHQGRWLRPHEIRAICQESPKWLSDIIQVAARTGMRLGEVTALKRASYVADLSGRSYLLVKRTKNGSQMVWPLEGALREIVEAAALSCSDPASYLFPGSPGWMRDNIDQSFLSCGGPRRGTAIRSCHGRDLS